MLPSLDSPITAINYRTSPDMRLQRVPRVPNKVGILDCTMEMTEGEERDDLCIVCVCVVVRGGDKTKVHKEDGCGHGREGKRRTRRRQSVERVLAIRALFAVNTHSERSGHLSLRSIFLRRHSRSHPQAKTGRGYALTRYRPLCLSDALASTRKNYHWEILGEIIKVSSSSMTWTR